MTDVETVKLQPPQAAPPTFKKKKKVSPEAEKGQASKGCDAICGL